jgi:hypothetical protein
VASAEAGEFSKFEPIVEINASDGDIGFHVLLDGEGWKLAQIYDSDWDKIFRAQGTDDFEEQGVTELFMESAEPLCWEDPEADPDEEIVTLEEFVERFEAGVYHARGKTIDNEPLTAEGELTHNLPAAPVTGVEIEFEDDDMEVEINWEVGTDLGNCEFPEGLIPDPASVEVVLWEVAIEPDPDQVPEGMDAGKLTLQLPGEVFEVEVPEEFIEAWLAAGVTQFKFEVGAREASGNQTFTEDTFEIVEP